MEKFTEDNTLNISINNKSHSEFNFLNLKKQYRIKKTNRFH
jgi:hypothetical protein